VRLLAESGAVRAWILAFVLMAGVGLGGLIGVGCLVGANVCPGRSSPKQTTLDGRLLFQANCAGCHGLNASGGRGPSLVSGHGATLDLQELVGRILNGKPLAGMPAFKRSDLSREQIDSIARYVVSLRGGGS
jgi:ubiquinol-cytochrome c reductase cytochrome c subunit